MESPARKSTRFSCKPPFIALCLLRIRHFISHRKYLRSKTNDSFACGRASSRLFLRPACNLLRSFPPESSYFSDCSDGLQIAAAPIDPSLLRSGKICRPPHRGTPAAGRLATLPRRFPPSSLCLIRNGREDHFAKDSSRRQQSRGFARGCPPTRGRGHPSRRDCFSYLPA